jgi:chemotaxis protein MotB
VRRRAEAPGSFNVWPAFTDVLGGLVVVLVFLITIFVIGEVLISRELSGKNTAIDQLASIIDGLESLIGESAAENDRLLGVVAQLEGRIRDRDQQVSELRRDLASADAAQGVLERTLDEAAREEERVRGELAARLAELRAEREGRTADIQASAAQVQALTARLEDLQFRLRRLNRALYGSRDQLALSQSALKASQDEAARLVASAEAQDAELARRQEQLQSQGERIAELDQKLRERLLERVEELERYSSDFFGRLREVFADNPDIKVAGDRFVFQSEVLFPSGGADLSLGGRDDLDQFVDVYTQVESKLPRDLPVIIEVQGHTDRVPIRTARYQSNWELSIFRALHVVNYLIEAGIPPERLAAVGMGENHPINTGTDPDSLRRNRRIELKITSR